MGEAGYGRTVLFVCAKTSGHGGGKAGNNNDWACERTFVFRGGPELGQLGSVRPIELGLQMKGWAIHPWLRRSSRGAPKNEDAIFSRIGAREGISNDDFDGIWINCTETRKGDVGGRIDDGSEDKVRSEQNQEGVDRPRYD
jgi:hypothetical protein